MMKRFGALVVAVVAATLMSIGEVPSTASTVPGVNGTIAFVRQPSSCNIICLSYDLWVAKSDGTDPHLILSNGTYITGPAVSPDGSKIAYSSNNHIWVANIDGTGAHAVTSSGDPDYDPAWSPDGSKLAFSRMVGGADYEIVWMSADGTGVVTQVTNDSLNDGEPAWSPNGLRIAYSHKVTSSSSSTDYDIHIRDAADGLHDAYLTTASTNDREPAWSPDGGVIAYTTDNDGTGNAAVNTRIWVKSVSASGNGTAVVASSTANDNSPSWAPDGKKVVFASDRDGYTHLFTLTLSGLVQAPLAADGVIGYTPDWGVPPPPPAPGPGPGPAAGKTLYGTAKKDVIQGTAGDDTIYAKGGNDIVYGNGGNDLIIGGAGNDKLFGGDGNDTLKGGKGTDKCDGGPGTDLAKKCERKPNVP